MAAKPKPGLIAFEPLHRAIGMEVKGVDLRDEIDADPVRRIRAA